jgi:hypothetical protein
MCLIAALALTVQTSAEKNRFTTIDPPGSTLTSPSAINPAGLITGHYVDARGQCHGFLRAADGTFTTIDPPWSVFWTSPMSINPAGVITGFYGDASEVQHGFLQAADGTFTIIDPPESTWTGPSGINPAGAITGVYFGTGSWMQHGFLRSR